jgi:hypothetical protein
MGFYREQILPHLTDRAFRGEEAARARARATAGLSGEVLEVGFGSGLTVPFYPPAVTRVRAVEPSAVAHKLAADKVAASTVPGRSRCWPSDSGHSVRPRAGRAGTAGYVLG